MYAEFVCEVCAVFLESNSTRSEASSHVEHVLLFSYCVCNVCLAWKQHLLVRCARNGAGMWWPEELRAAVSSRLFICGKCLFAHIGKWVACGNEGEPFYMFYMWTVLAVLRAILYALPLLARSTWLAIRFPLSANAILCYCIRVPCEYSI